MNCGDPWGSSFLHLQYGSVDYHKQSLRNLQAAVRKTRRLCAVVLDTFGRELVVRRQYEVDETVNIFETPKLLDLDREPPIATNSILPHFPCRRLSVCKYQVPLVSNNH